jgi:TfoX/Sxy family transcriptional regulator of competence genes
VNLAMAEPYYSQLSAHIETIHFPNVVLECKHFFSGAAVYANGKIFASLSPAGFAVKLPEDVKAKLIRSDEGTEFRFFPQGPIKKEYVRLNETFLQDEQDFHEIMNQGIRYVVRNQA